MKKYIKEILNKRVFILLISILLLIAGVYSYIQIPKQEMPDINTVYGYVQIVAPGLSAKEIQSEISNELEGIIKSYSDVESFKTTSLSDTAIVLIEMAIGDSTSSETIEKIKNDILNFDFDDSVTDIYFVSDLNTAEIIYAVHSDTLNEYELKEIASSLSDELEIVKNVSKTTIHSAYSEEVIIELDYIKMGQLSLTLKDVYSIVVANGMDIPLGSINSNTSTSGLTINSNYTSIEDVENLMITASETGVITIKDIAKVYKANTDNKMVFEFNEETAAFVEVYFDDSIDFTVIGDEIKEVVEDFSNSTSSEVSITPMIFSPDYVGNQVSQVMINLLQCIGIVMLIVLFGLGFRNAIAIAITIPVIVMTTISILYLSGSDFQLMSIAGLIVSIGILVDNSIVISESTQHYLDRGLSSKNACHAAVKKNYLAVLSSTLTTVAAFAPLLTLPGVAGDVAFSLPLTILIAICLSYIVAITLTPALASMLFKAKKKTKTKKRNKKVDGIIRKILNFTFKLSILPTLVAIMALILLSYGVVNNLSIDLLPKTEKSILYIDYEYKESDNDKAYLFAKDIEKIVSEQEDIVNFGFSQGGNLPKFYITLNNINQLPQNGRFFIELDCNPNDLNEYVIRLDEDLMSLRSEGTIVVDRLELSQPTAPVQIVLTSNDYNNLQIVGENIFNDISGISSFKSGELIAPSKVTDILIDMDRGTVNGYGLSVIEVKEQIALAVNGLSSELFLDDGNKLNIKVKNNFSDIEELLDLNIRNSQGVSTQLRDLITISEVESLEYISEFNGVPSITIDAYMEEGYSTYELEKDIKHYIDQEIDNSINVIYKGDNELTNEVFKGIILALIIAMFVIYFIMYLQFKSFLQPLIIFVTIPLSFIGSLAVMLIMDELITLTGLLGLVSLIGIVVNNGILLVEYINSEIKKGNSVYESCITAVSRRLRPIILTSLTTILGLTPLAFFGGDFFRPLALVLMGGLFTSTVLVLFVVPGLYYVSYKKKDM